MTWNQNDFWSGATLFDLARLTSYGGMRGGNCPLLNCTAAAGKSGTAAVDLCWTVVMEKAMEKEKICGKHHKAGRYCAERDAVGKNVRGSGVPGDQHRGRVSSGCAFGGQVHSGVSVRYFICRGLFAVL